MPRPKILTPDQEAEIVRRWKRRRELQREIKQHSPATIAAELGISATTIFDVIDRHLNRAAQRFTPTQRKS